MSTAVRTVGETPGTASEHNQILRALRREQSEVFEPRLRQLSVPWTPMDAVDVNEIEALSDDCSGAGIGAGLLEIADTDHVVVSICGRDRRLRIL